MHAVTYAIRSGLFYYAISSFYHEDRAISRYTGIHIMD